MKVISGGQTGADQAALLAARQVGLETGGTAPEGFQTERGPMLELRDVYGLSAEGTCQSRTIKNVNDSDGTVVLLVHDGSDGSSKTIGWASKRCWEDSFESKFQGGHRPVLVLHAENLEEDQLSESALKIVEFVRRFNIGTLNVAGHRQSGAFIPPFYTGKAPYDYQQRCFDLLLLAFKSLVRNDEDERSERKNDGAD